LHFVQVFGGEKAPVAEQGLVHRAQLVDGQQLVADAAPALAFACPTLLATGERHEADDGLPHMVGETHLGQQWHGGFVKQAAVQWGQGEGVFGTGQGFCKVLLFTGGILEAAAIGDQAEQAAQGGVEIKAVTRMGRVERLHLQLAQGFQAVALEVDLALGDGHIAQLGPGLDVEHEQQPVDHAQAFQAEVGRVELVFAAEEAFFGIRRLFAQLVGGLVAQQLDGFAQGVFKVFAHAKGVFVGVFVQAFQQADASPGAKLSWCKSAAAACRVAVSLRSRMSTQSKRKARLLGHL
jgi:hypothetical protein